MASLTGSQIEFVTETFRAIDASGARLAGKEFDGCTFVDCNLSDATFDGCRLVECSFLRCNLSLARFDTSRLLDVAFEACKLVGIDWTRAAWPALELASPLKLVQCIATDSSFFGLSLNEIVMRECKAHDVDFREGSFCEADFSQTDFLNSLFNRTNLTGADFTGASNYRIDVFSNEIRRAKFSRDEAIGLLVGLDIELVD
jgi:fluoroquinolone resistance protein